MIIKTNPNIVYKEFLSLLDDLKEFSSIKGNVYTVVSLNNSVLTFVRESTKIKWKMDLKKVYQAYNELKKFKTIDFKPYLPRKQSPALGLLLSIGLLQKIND